MNSTERYQATNYPWSDRRVRVIDTTTGRVIMDIADVPGNLARAKAYARRKSTERTNTDTTSAEST